MKSILVVTVLLTNACGRPESASTPSTSSSTIQRAEQIRNVPEYEPNANVYLQEFVNDAVRSGIVIEPERLATIKLEFVEGKITQAGPGAESALGVCKWYDNEVYMLKPAFWAQEYPSQLRYKRVVYHELGHCLFHLLHLDAVEVLDRNGQMVQVTGSQRIMGSREALLNHQLPDPMWPNLLTVFHSYARAVATDTIDGIKDAEGVALTSGHDPRDCTFYQP